MKLAISCLSNVPTAQPNLKLPALSNARISITFHKKKKIYSNQKSNSMEPNLVRVDTKLTKRTTR